MDKTLVFGHKNPDTDSICSSIVKEILNRKEDKEESKAVRLGNINKETEYVLNYLHIDAPEFIESVDEGQKVILVDHNDFAQSADNIENAQIIEVVDHHRIGNFKTIEPLYFTAKPYGCTSTILYQEFVQKGIVINKLEAILMASAIISDTLLLKSPTTTDYDKKALAELEKISGINVESYGLEMLKAGTNLDDFSSEELLHIDAKNLEKNGLKYIIAQVNTVSIEDVLKREDEIKAAINNEIEKQNLCLFAFAITDILNSNSEMIILGEKAGITKTAFGKDLVNDRVFLEGVVSRKKQILPLIDKNI